MGFYNSFIRLAEITDGTSNTFLFLEAMHSKHQSWLPANKGSNHFIWVHHASQGYVQARTNGNLPSPPNDTQGNTRSSASQHPRRSASDEVRRKCHLHQQQRRSVGV